MDEMPQPAYLRTIFICCNEREPGEAACANRGSRDLQKALKQYVKENGLREKIRITRSLCLGLCSEGPNICIQPENVWYNHVNNEDIPKIIENWIKSIEDSP